MFSKADKIQPEKSLTATSSLCSHGQKDPWGIAHVSMRQE
jgi:hypothetical protein